MKITAMVSGLAITCALAGAASAQQQYVRGSAGFSMLSDSDNSGNFTEDFALGLDAGTIPSGTGLGWSTEFDSGYFVSGAYGFKLSPNFRLEGEVSYSGNDVDTHSGVSVDGLGVIDTIDAGVLLGESQTDPLGVTVGDLVSDGQGSIETLGLAGNAFYDFAFGASPFSAYIGGGIGIANVDVEYSPSGVGIVNDDDTVFMYQVMVGGEYAASDTIKLYGGYRFRATEDVETDVSLFPASLEIENSANIFEAGVRFEF